MIDVGKFERVVAEAGDDGMQVTKPQLLELVQELRLGNAARLLLATDVAVAGVCAALLAGAPA